MKAMIIIATLLIATTYSSFSIDGILEGKVYDANNKPIKNATVELNGFNYKSVTNEKGEYSILEIPEGNYEAIIYVNNNISFRKRIEIIGNKLNNNDFICNNYNHKICNPNDWMNIRLMQNIAIYNREAYFYNFSKKIKQVR